MPDLVEGMQYKFRVRAVNKAGTGAPSGESKTMTAKARFGTESRQETSTMSLLPPAIYLLPHGLFDSAFRTQLELLRVLPVRL